MNVLTATGETLAVESNPVLNISIFVAFVAVTLFIVIRGRSSIMARPPRPRSGRTRSPSRARVRAPTMLVTLTTPSSISPPNATGKRVRRASSRTALATSSASGSTVIGELTNTYFRG